MIIYHRIQVEKGGNEGAERPRENNAIQGIHILSDGNAVVVEKEGWEVLGSIVGL